MTLKIKNMHVLAAGMVVLAILQLSCGRTGPPPKQDITPPIVINTIPADGNTDYPNGFPITGTIKITFDGAMDPTTINAKTIVVTTGTGSITGSVLYGNNSAFFTPDQPLLENTQYKVTINAMVADAAGNHMGRDYFFLFITQLLPSVQATDPQNGDVNVAVNHSISITFSKKVDPATLIFSLISDKTGSIPFDPPSTTDIIHFSVVPHATSVDSLEGNTHYTATVSAGLQDFAGNTMQQDYVWEFTTGPSRDTTPPFVQVTNPENGAVDVSVTPQITVTFDELLNTSTTPTLMLFTEGTSTIICQRLSYPISDQMIHKFVLPPDRSPLNYATQYKATISAGLKDTTLPVPNVMTVPYSWTFTTVKASTTTSISVPDTIPYGSPVTVTVNVLSSVGTPTVGFVTLNTAPSPTLTLTQPLNSIGVASFTISNPGLNYHTLIATYVPALNSIYQGSVSSGGFNVSAAGSSTTVTSSSAPSTFGASVTFTATVSPSTATGSVMFSDGATVLGTGSLLGGTATFSTAALAVGTHQITATYSGDVTYTSSTSSVFTQTVNPTTPTTAINAPAVAFGANGIVTVTVTSSAGTPTGSVTLVSTSPTLTQTQPLISGVAIFTITSPSTGSHSLTATYSAQGNYGASSANGTLSVGMAGTTTSIASSSATSTFGVSVIFTSTITPSTATGSVTFKDGATVLGTGSLSGGTATFSTAALTGGSHSITAVYGGDANFTTSTSSAITQTVNKATTTAIVGSNFNPSTFGASVTFSAAVTPSTATGNMTFSDGATVLGTISLSGGLATFSTTTLAVGNHSITATYSGDGNYGSSTSSAITQTVNKAASTTYVTSSPGPNPSAFGVSVTFTATVGPSTATGTVTFSEGAIVLGSGSLSAGKATFSTAALAVGTHTITAAYSGDGNYVVSTGTFDQYVSNTGTATSVNSSPRPSDYGVSVTFTATVIPSAAAGIVTFRDGAAILGTGTLSNGLASFVTSSLGAGLHEIYADYGGDSGYVGSTSTPLAHRVKPANQTIGAISFNPLTVAVNGSTTASATATSGLGVTFSTSTPLVCSVNASSGLVAGLTAGTCTIVANQAGDSNYNAAPPATQDIAVAKANQTIGAISFNPLTVAVNGSTTASATATSGLGVTFSTSTPLVCSVNASSGLVAGLTAGTCTIVANQAGNSNYNAAPPATQDIAVAKANQTIGAISFNPLTVAVNGSTTASATATSGLGVTFSTSTPSVCSVNASSGLVAGLTAGTCTIVANQAGNSNYNAAPPATQDIAVAKANQTIGAISFNPLTVAVNGSTTASATATSGLGVTFSTSTPLVCSVNASSGLVAGLTAGTCTIVANQAGDSNYNAAPPATQDIAVAKANQTIGAISFNPLTVAVNGSTTASATATSGLGVTFSTSTPLVCSVNASSGLVAGLTAGTCTIVANQAGNSNYNAAPPATQDIAVAKANQTIGAISFNPLTVAVNGSTTASATATSGLGVTFSTSTPLVCSVNASSGLVAGLTAGTCTIVANQAGNSNYNAAPPATQDIAVAKANQTIGAISFNPLTVAVNGSTTASATATSGLGVTFSTSTPLVCSVNASSGLVAGLTAGTCTIVANQAGNSNYNAAPPATQDIAVAKANQTIGAISFNPLTVAVNGSTTASATATSGLGVTFSTSTPSVCSVNASSGLVAGLTAGTCTIVANQAGNSNYNAAPPATQDIAVAKANQTIGAISFNPLTVAVNGSTTASATATSGLGVTFSTSTPLVCSVNASSGLVAGLTAGTCTIVANQAGDSNYNAAPPATQDIAVAKANQTIGAISFNPLTVAVNGSTTASATATSGLGVTFSTSTPLVCSVNASSGLVAGLTAGTCTIVANQAGNSNYNAAPPATQDIAVAKANQTIGAISFNPLTVAVNGSTTASATATSGLGVTFSTSTPLVCSVNASSGLVAGLTAGTCTIVANQAGNSNYNAAPPATQDIAVAKANQTIGAISFNPLTVAVNGSTTASATATSGLGVTFSTSTPLVCSVNASSGLVAGLTAGTCTIVANQAGDSNYNAAPPATQDIAVAKANQTIGAISFNPLTVAVNGSTTASATATSGLGVTFSTSTPSVCSVNASSGLVAGLTAGTCTIVANQAGNSNYNAAPPATQDIAVAKANQVGFSIVPLNNVSAAMPTTLSTNGGGGNGTVIFSAGPANICYVAGVAGDQLYLTTDSGLCTVTATKAADNNYNEATATISGEVTGGIAPIISSIQGIGFGSLSAMSFLMNHKLFGKLFRRRRKQKDNNKISGKEG